MIFENHPKNVRPSPLPLTVENDEAGRMDVQNGGVVVEDADVDGTAQQEVSAGETELQQPRWIINIQCHPSSSQ